MSIGNFIGIALRNIHHGGQRMFVAVLCIMFGVMSLVGMSGLAAVMRETLLIDPRLRFGGDMELTPAVESFVMPEHLEMFAAMQESGEITAYMPLATNYSITIRTMESGEMHFIQTGLGIDPAMYPLVGEMIMQEPAGADADDLLNEVGDLLITKDLAETLGAEVGETLVLGDMSSSVAVQGTVRGIIGQTADGTGGKLLYDMNTAQELAGNEAYMTSVLATAEDPETAQATLEANGWWAYPLDLYTESHRDSQALWDLVLKGAGILGLLVGGIGITNTMQVLLARRTRDIAIYKTLGYSQRDILSLFMLEAAILGIVGSVLGAGAGILLGQWLVMLLGQTTFLMEWKVDPVMLVVAMLVGIATTVIFATYAIVRTSSVRPSALLRNEHIELDTMGRLKGLGLWVLLAIPFTIITTLILGSPDKGIGMVLFAVAGLVVLGGVFAGLVWVVTRVIPARRFPLLGISLSSLRRRGLSLVFAMIALFVGTVTLTLAAVITQGAERELGERTVEIDGYDLTILAPAANQEKVETALDGYPKADVSYDLQVREVTAPDMREAFINPTLTGQPFLTDMSIVDGPAWEDQVDGAYVYPLAIPIGTEIAITLLDGSTITMPVIGHYDIDYMAPAFGMRLGVLMHPDTLLGIAEPERVTFNLDVPDAQLAGITTDLGQKLPDAIVINRYAYINRFAKVYQSLFLLGMAMAGLALLAGVLLVANAVSLAMINRRYEIGVLKAVGYTRSHILRLLTVEYTIIGVIAAIAGVVATVATLFVVGEMNETASGILSLDWTTSIAMMVLTVVLTLLTVMITGWKPTQIAPMVVLADRE